MKTERPDGLEAGVAAAFAAVAAASFLFSGVFSFMAPGGAWLNAPLGARLWVESDPGGYYLLSAASLYSSGGRLLYPGHPGLPLQVLLNAVESVSYALRAPADARFGFAAFLAKRSAHVFFLSKMLITGLHVFSFALLYLFARRLLGRTRAALLAAFAYATSLPPLYYLSRVSVEPLMMIFFFSLFLCVWRSLEETQRRRAGAAAWWSALGGAASVAGLATKFHLLWPLPLLGFGHLLLGDDLPGARGGAARVRARVPAAAAFAAAAFAALASTTSILDWRDFFGYWGVGGMGGGSWVAGAAGLVARQAGVVAELARGVGRMPAAAYVPGATKTGLYLFCELPLLGFAAFGAVRLFLRAEERRGRWLWLAAGVGYTLLIWAYRCFAVSGDFHGFHYLFVFTAFCAVFFGEAADALLARFGPAAGSRAALAAAAVLLAAVHAVPLWAVFDGRVRDAFFYAQVGALDEARGRLAAGERVALIGLSPEAAVAASGLGVIRYTPPDRSAVLEELAGDYVAADRAGLEKLLAAPGARPIGAVVALANVAGVPTVTGPFEPARWLATAR